MHCGDKKWGKIKEDIIGLSSQTNSILFFKPPNHCANYHQNRIKIAAVGVFTDLQITDGMTE